MFTQYNITIIKYFSFNNLHKILTNNNMTWPIDNKSKHYAPPTNEASIIVMLSNGT